jgi:transcription initiation factor TFIIIB Brf1 subunit/transcription initiation factor TFIIB
MPTDEANTLNADHIPFLSSTNRCPICLNTVEPLRNATMGVLWCSLCQRIFTQHEVDRGPRWERLK